MKINVCQSWGWFGFLNSFLQSLWAVEMQMLKALLTEPPPVDSVELWFSQIFLNTHKRKANNIFLPPFPFSLSAERLQKIFIHVSNNSDGSSAQQCAYDAEPYLSSETRVYCCPAGTTGEYVRIRFDATYNNYLQLCEVQIRGRGIFCHDKQCYSWPSDNPIHICGRSGQQLWSNIAAKYLLELKTSTLSFLIVTCQHFLGFFAQVLLVNWDKKYSYLKW